MLECVSAGEAQQRRWLDYGLNRVFIGVREIYGFVTECKVLPQCSATTERLGTLERRSLRPTQQSINSLTIPHRFSGGRLEGMSLMASGIADDDSLSIQALGCL